MNFAGPVSSGPVPQFGASQRQAVYFATTFFHAHRDVSDSHQQADASIVLVPGELVVVMEHICLVGQHHPKREEFPSLQLVQRDIDTARALFLLSMALISQI